MNQNITENINKIRKLMPFITFPIKSRPIFPILSAFLLSPTQPKVYTEHLSESLFPNNILAAILYQMKSKQLVFHLTVPHRDRKLRLTIKPMFSGAKSQSLNHIVKSLILSQMFTEHQHRLHNLQIPVQTKMQESLFETSEFQDSGNAALNHTQALQDTQVTGSPRKLTLQNPQTLC